MSGLVNDAQFDVNDAGQVIEHTWQPGLIIKECSRILKKDGVLILDTPNVYGFRALIRYFILGKDTVGMDDNLLGYNEAKDNYKQYRSDKQHILSQPQHKIFYSAAMLRQLLNMHGFAIEKLIYVKKPKNIIYKLLLNIFPQGGQKIAVIARKKSLEDIFSINSI